jgi:hypothetical protein
MASNPLSDLVMAAATLKGSNPVQFQALCAAFRDCEKQAVVELTAADTVHDMFRAQGKLKTVRQLRKHLVECSELRDTYQRRDSHARPTTL